ncbi:hypothetical protein [Mesorhizobium captivum]|uniref:hypothetical protein n=1 Tax=Mesorhizobium captivum TaxID=3072319 RepID=UPI002A24354E|nr:hypothetical protein [Mesorhizobium sp. VK3C]MDX8449113.1 hypothetical protein [Mesorhizobium sp. VK3C]
MDTTDKRTDDQKFNDTLKRMLKTPPKPHDAADKAVLKPSRSAGDRKQIKKTDSQQ